MASHILWKWAITCYNTGIAILRGNMATNVMGCVDSYTPKILETLDFKESGEFSHCFLFVGPFCSFQTPRITYLFHKQKPLVSKRMQGKSSKQVSVYAELWLIRDGIFSWTQMGLPRPHFAVWDSHRSRQSGLWSTCFFFVEQDMRFNMTRLTRCKECANVIPVILVLWDCLRAAVDTENR